MQETTELRKLPRLRSLLQRVLLCFVPASNIYVLSLIVFAIFQCMVSRKPSESTVNPCNMQKTLKIAGCHNWNIISENFVRHTDEVAGQSVRQLKISILRFGKLQQICWHHATDLLPTSRYQDAFAWLATACWRHVCCKLSTDLLQVDCQNLLSTGLL